jgi:KDO2-lipid IV(A) lauroyltransferase
MITRSLIWLLHILPEPILFLCSDLFYLLAYHVVGYRKKVVYRNLRRAFPEYTDPEVRRTARRFYHHLCDLILESAISHFYSRSKAMTRMIYRNPELLNDIYRTGKQVMAVMGHYGNWEYLNTLGMVCDYPVKAIYKPLKNKYFDRMVRGNRERFGVETVPMEKVARELITHHRNNEPVLTVFLSDQRPMLHNIQYWTTFLEQDTPLYLGTEKLARKLDAAVVFFRIRKIRRGRYEMEVVPLCVDPSGMKPYEITEAHVRILEEQIRETPEFWLWSHRRWKHSKEKWLEERQSPP